ncbi:hypothetical protein FZ983_28125 [Azospirillum sp. B21]|uniref:hypothetical protein n=1 Tax=Azospirillum sp. B21 TaxID=2607496 RepID=UPI0011F06169|nr:hypothetical protein [Azospirillum sp. B21]KAA0574402.1 hypothetical protein FZ983_28125 [Azospirillum sp. B21]
MRSASVFPTLVLLGIAAPALADDPTFLIEQQVGQATSDTCQSYVLAIALAFKRDPAFPLRDWRSLRTMEERLRAEVVKARNARYETEAPGTPESKRFANVKDYKIAINNATNSKYTVQEKAYDIDALGNTISGKTGISSKSNLGASFILGNAVKDVAISSATKIGDKIYKDGHLFTILGVSGPPNSTREYLVLNSAAYKIKGSPPFNACQESLPDSTGPYFATLAWRNDIEWKLSGGKYRVITIENQ